MLILNIPVKHQQCQVDQMYAIYEIMKARTLYKIKDIGATRNHITKSVTGHSETFP